MDRLREIFRRIRALASFARVLRVDSAGALQVFQVEGALGEIRDGVVRIGEYGLASDPPEDSQAVVLALGGDRGQLVAVGVEDRETRPVLFAGETSLYTEAGVAFRAVPLSGANTTAVLGDNVDVGTTPSSTVDVGGQSVSVVGWNSLILYGLGSAGITVFATSGPVNITGPSVVINTVDFSTHTHTVPAGTDSAGGVTGVPQ